MTRAIKIGSMMMAGLLGFAFMPSRTSANPRITTTASLCQAKTGSQAGDIDMVGTGGVWNKNTGSTRDVLCSVPRTPLDAGSTRANLYVDGNNTGGASTTITLLSYSWEGLPLGSSTVTTNVATYDEFLTLPAAQANEFAYFHLLVKLPTNKRGTLRGFSSSDSP